MFGWFHISGHSGTQFKHRKVFQKATKLQEFQHSKTPRQILSTQEAAKLNDELQERFSRARYFGWVSKISFLPLFVGFFFLFFFALHYITRGWVAYENELRQDNGKMVAHYFREEHSNAYQVLVKTGNAFLAANELEAAQEEFIRAIRLNRYGVEANIGLSKTLSQRCLKEDKWCLMALAYIDFSIDISPDDWEELTALRASLPCTPP